MHPSAWNYLAKTREAPKAVKGRKVSPEETRKSQKLEKLREARQKALVNLLVYFEIYQLLSFLYFRGYFFFLLAGI
jgi:hypothetical protein